MEKRTVKTTYCVQNRHRKHTGAARNFDCAALAQLINGPEVQERVKHRDMYGYFGHWPRVKFGMNPAEGGVVDGKPIAIEPAFVTTSLSADAQGNITHEAEFLETAPGRGAYRLMQSQKGGFSSAIDTRKRGNVDYPLAFYGFDYVLSPNFSGNRPYSMKLDSMSADELAEYAEMLDDASGTIGVLDKYILDLEKALDDATAALQRREQDVEVLLGMVASDKAATALDSAGFTRVTRIDPCRTFDAILGVSNTIHLEGYAPLPAEPGDQSRMTGFVDAVAERLSKARA